MVILRAFPQCRTHFSGCLTASRATSSMLLSSRVAIPQRQFTSGTRFLQVFSNTPATESERARSIALLSLPKRAVKSEIEAFIKNAGVEIKRMQLRLDRFTFHNDSQCFVELADEHQAQKAAERLHEKALMGQTVYVRTPLKEGFDWTQGSRSEDGSNKSCYFYQDDATPSEAIKPLIEGRRVMLSVMTPGWGDGKVSTRMQAARDVIEKYLGEYGIEAIGGFSPFYGDKQPTPRLLCLMDFTTKEGATSAIEAVHKKEIEGREVWLKLSEMAPWRAHHVGKVDKSVLTTLQEKGLAPQEVYADQFLVTKKEKKEQKKLEKAEAQKKKEQKKLEKAEAQKKKEQKKLDKAEAQKKKEQDEEH